MSLRPDHPPKITVDDLKPGDVVLSAGDSGWIDEFILLIDEGDYTHATCYVGERDGHRHAMVEAGKHGVITRDLSYDYDQVLIDAYRFESADGHHLGDPGWPVEPVTAGAESFVGGPYAYSELLMGALVLVVSEVPASGKAAEIVRIVGQRLEHELQKFLETLEGEKKTPMTCVQVCTSAYWQADPGETRRYGLEVTIDGARKVPWPVASDASGPVGELARLRERVAAVLGESLATPAADEKGGVTVKVGSPLLPLGSCTPRDMETSPSLRFVGCLKDERS